MYIVVTLGYLRHYLTLVSCFGSQTDISLLQYLEQIEEGLISSIDTFVNEGILNQIGPIISFGERNITKLSCLSSLLLCFTLTQYFCLEAHDLIEEEVYNSMTMADKRSLHLKLGEYLGSRASQLQLRGLEFFGGMSITSSLISIACDQINSCAEIITDQGKKIEYAGWNLSAASQQSNARVALHYCMKGLGFLGDNRWHLDLRQLCSKLYNGAILASFALGKPVSVSNLVTEVEENSTFETSLEIMPVMFKSWFQLGKHEECIRKGIGILRKLRFDFPLDPTPER